MKNPSLDALQDIAVHITLLAIAAAIAFLLTGTCYWLFDFECLGLQTTSLIIIFIFYGAALAYAGFTAGRILWDPRRSLVIKIAIVTLFLFYAMAVVCTAFVHHMVGHLAVLNYCWASP